MTCQEQLSVGRPLRGGFSLVELITVMSIIVILVTLVIGGVQGMRQQQAIEATRELITALDAALQRYYEDWGKYPWKNDTDNPALLGKVDTTPEIGYSPLATAADKTYEVEAILYAALNMRQRRGPYMVSGAGQAARFSWQQYSYYIYVDGWGRPIRYKPPRPGATVPLLESQGANEFDDDQTPNDNITNY